MSIASVDISQFNDAYFLNRSKYMENVKRIAKVLKDDPLTTEITNAAGNVLSQDDVYKLVEKGIRKSYLVSKVDAQNVKDIIGKFQLVKNHPELDTLLDSLFVAVNTDSYEDIRTKLTAYNDKMQATGKAVKAAAPVFTPTLQPLPPSVSASHTRSSYFTLRNLAKWALVVGGSYYVYQKGGIKDALSSAVSDVSTLVRINVEPNIESRDYSIRDFGTNPNPLYFSTRVGQNFWEEEKEATRLPQSHFKVPDSGVYKKSEERLLLNIEKNSKLTSNEPVSQENNPPKASSKIETRNKFVKEPTPSVKQKDNDNEKKLREKKLPIFKPHNVGPLKEVILGYNKDEELFLEDFMKVLDPDQCIASSEGGRALREWLRAIWHNSSNQEIAVFAVGLALAAASAAQGLRGQGTPTEKFVRSLLVIGSVSGGILGVYQNLLNNEALSGKGKVFELRDEAYVLNALKQLELTTFATAIPILMGIVASKDHSAPGRVLSDSLTMGAQNLVAVAAGGHKKSIFANNVLRDFFSECVNLGKDFDFSGHAMMQTVASSAYVRAFTRLQEAGYDSLILGSSYLITPIMASANAVFMYNTAVNFHSPAEMAAGAAVGAGMNLLFTYPKEIVSSIKNIPASASALASIVHATPLPLAKEVKTGYQKVRKAASDLVHGLSSLGTGMAKTFVYGMELVFLTKEYKGRRNMVNQIKKRERP